MACINPRNIPEILLPQPTSRKQKIEALGLLNAYSFIYSQGTGLAIVHENEFVVQGDNYLGLTEKIAGCLASDGRYQEAEILYKKLTRINQDKAGSEHSSTLRSMANLASTYRNQGRWNEAEKLEVQVMETRKTVLGAEHPDTLTSMANLAFTWKFQGKLQDALSLMDKCCHLPSKVLGPSHQYSRSFSCTLSDWMDEYNTLPKQTTLTRKECPQALREVSAGPPAAVVTAQLVREEHINLPYTQRRSAAKLLLRNHPLIIATRTPSPAPEDQDLQDVD
ncbi:kinesin light chain, putative [Talaromyces stipitatus ATCC 10500]|uniref:Kinesin light chain, putative n=1 Tax=Talaromyces stipitatus (strain ATCC 10500 / CBS 375.48 / QM 6759 / NRRL 1006) TaxID=441959 RepID=B8MU84_TALSN|nr:kinesin light chain, putative [Talaromyces stipitatus ATCC 10500]EED11588.1 kinesin light chain, putative [Talaromyces stipitatus ATCC 10500]